jgi:alpha-methylacyl-CoA racemase
MQGDKDGKSVEQGQGPGSAGEGWSASGLVPGHGGIAVLAQWLGWKEGKDFQIQGGGLVKAATARL